MAKVPAKIRVTETRIHMYNDGHRVVDLMRSLEDETIPHCATCECVDGHIAHTGYSVEYNDETKHMSVKQIMEYIKSNPSKLFKT